MKRVLFYCDTPYQVFTAINIILDKHSNDRCELAIYHQFNEAKSLAEKVQSSGLVRHIYNLYPPRSSSADIMRLIQSKAYLIKNGFADLQFQEIYFACLDTNASLALYSSINFDKCYLFDDGTGSYRGDIINDNMSKKRKWLLQISHPIKNYFTIDKFFLYAPEMSNTRIRVKKEKINIRNVEIIKNVFVYIENSFYEKRFIFLDQPYSKTDRVIYDEKIDLLFSDTIFDELVIRMHPRMTEASISASVLDTINNMWELECLEQLSEENILISIYSSAMFQPYVIANISPKLIFLYKIYGDIYSDEDRKNIDMHVSSFSRFFSDAKIYVPSTINELKKIIQTFL